MTEEQKEFVPMVCEDNNQPAIYDRILDIAIRQGAPLEQLEKFLDLKRQYEADEARKEFYQAIADFKGEKVLVSKDKTNNQFKSQYTSLGNLLNTVNPVLGKYGLSVSFDLKQSEKMITVACILRHRMGYTERVELSAPPDVSGGNSKNPIQQIKSTITYLRASTFEAVTGLASTDANLDDDGNSAYTEEYISGDDLQAIVKLHKQVYSDKDDKSAWDKWWKFAGSTNWDAIPKKNMNKILNMLNERRVAQSREPGQDG